MLLVLDVCFYFLQNFIDFMFESFDLNWCCALVGSMLGVIILVFLETLVNYFGGIFMLSLIRFVVSMWRAAVRVTRVVMILIHNPNQHNGHWSIITCVSLCTSHGCI